MVHFGTSNPSGLRGKESLAADLGPGVWHFSETQLSAVSLPSSARALKALTRTQRRDVRILAGAPAPLRSGSSWAGAWSGVLTLSDYACRPLQLQWMHEAYHTGRVQVLHHHVHGAPVLTANVYGFPQGNTFANPRARTEQLLETLTHELVLGRKGIRIISGDFNHWHGDLEQVNIWKLQGWVEAQDLAQALWQQVPQPTCKHATHRDFVFLSPEAAALCKSVEVREVFAEHSTIIAGLRLNMVASPQSWPLPAEIPWQHVDIPSWQASCVTVPIDESCPTRWLKDFALGFERSLNGFLTTVPGGHLPHRCHGRAQRLSPDSPPQVAPPKTARPGEEASHHDLLSLEVKRWYQQLRRLQSLDHAMKAGNQSPSAIEHRGGLWHSILSAKGFRPDFASWWLNRPVHLVGAPTAFPLHLPTASTCHLLFLDFRDNYRKFEAWHINQRKAILAEQYAHQRNLIFQDLRDPAPEQVDSLELRRSYGILAVDESTGRVHLDATIEDRGCSFWQLDGCAVQVADVSGDVCRLVDCPNVPTDAELEQHTMLSSARHVQQEFERLWASYWSRHDSLSDADWSPIVAFAQAFLPSAKLELAPLTLPEWRRAIKRFKPRAARGPDGLAKLDLQHMSDAHAAQLVSFLNGIETGDHSWPAQWLVGLVCCLKKPGGRQDAQGFRPICLLSCVYRAWSGLRARQILRWLTNHAPPEALGFMPRKEASQFWWLLAAQIETACQSDEPLLGFSTDIVKAFNVLPRQPVFAIAAHLGVTSRVLQPWQAFLDGLERRFLIRQSVGSSLMATCGFPEGCALSTVSMSLFCLCFHKYVETFSTGVSPHSYVDNLSCLGSSVGKLSAGVNLARAFLDMWRLEADPAKTYVWALNPSHRASLASLGLQVLQHARELGGTLSFGRSLRNNALVQRCKDLTPLFQRLRRSPCSLRVKLAALPSKFWRKALHGISGCPLGDGHLATLRAQTTKALQCHPAGTSSMLRLSLSDPVDADPGYFQLWSTLSDLRRIASKEPQVLPMWAGFMLGFSGTVYQGPFSKLLQVLSQIGWRIDSPPFVTDAEGVRHNLLEMPQALLRRKSEQAWLNYVAAQHRHRRTMHDLNGIDRSLVFADTANLSPLDTARLYAIRCGAFLFGACHARYDCSQDGLCQRCRVPDTHKHRVCECPLFEAARAPHQSVCNRWDQLPTCLSHHLLPPANPHLAAFHACLLALPDQSGSFASLARSDETQHLFCDGACNLATLPDLALAAWGAVNSTTGDIVACGPVPGLAQTAPRAELWGAIACLRWGLRVGCSLMVWTDSFWVGVGIRAAIEGHFQLPHDNSDLWTLLVDLVACYQPGQLGAQHVPSHLEPSTATSPFEDWAIHWNSRVDRLAGTANLNRPAELHDARSRALDWHNTMLTDMRALRSIYFDIAEVTLRRTGTESADEDPPEQLMALPVPEDGIEYDLEEDLPVAWSVIAPAACPDMPQRFVLSVCEILFTHGGQPRNWHKISWIELVFLLHLTGAVQFPVRSLTSDAWLPAHEVPLGAPALTVAVQIGLVRRLVQRVLKAFQLDTLLFDDASVLELGICFRMGGACLPVNGLLLQRARLQVSQFCSGRKVCTVGDLARTLH